MKKTLTIPVLGIPVVFFLLSRMTSFFSGAWDINFLPAAQVVVFAASILLLFVFRKKAYIFVTNSAYGFGGIAVTIYLLSVLVCYKYRGVVFNGCEYQGIGCIVGGGLLLGLFVLLCIKGADCLLQRLGKPSQRAWIFFVVAAVFLNLQAVLYCIFMKKIFVWDNAGYFVTVHKLNHLFPSIEYFKSVYQSVFETDYNYIIAFPASLLCKLFGKSRLVFILSIVNFYLLPLVMLIYAVASRIFKKWWTAILAVLALPYLVFATNTGFIDIGGVLFALLAVVIFIWGDGKEMTLIAGILLALCVLLRRWYAFFAISFIITSVLWGISHKKVKSCIYLTLSFGFVLLFFAQPFVSEKLLADYSDIYSAYSLGMETDIKIFTRYFGTILPAVLSVWAVFTQIKAKLKMTPEFFMWLQGIICFTLFTSVQTHGQQHLALYAPAFIILVLSSLSYKSRKKKVSCLTAMVCALCVINCVSVFIPRVQPQSISKITGIALVPTFSVYPPVDKNAESFLEITEYMDEEIGGKGKTVCFLASSLEMNYDTLRNAEISLSVKKKHDIDRESYYLTISDVDKRDGLAESLFEADYIFVPSTLQIHLAPDEQRVICVPYEQLISGEGIGKAYERQEKIFVLNSGDEIFIFKKIRDVTNEEKENLKKIINKKRQ